MSRYYASIHGATGKIKTMTGNGKVGIRGHFSGQNIGVKVEAVKHPTRDIFRVSLTGGSKSPNEYTGTLVEVEDRGQGSIVIKDRNGEYNA